MSMDKGSMDKGGSTTTEMSDLYYLKVEGDELYTISPDHVYRDDLNQRVDIANAIIELDSEMFKISG